MSSAPPRVFVLCEMLLCCLVWTSAGSVTRDKRSDRLSRMPIFYGKRSDTALTDDLFQQSPWSEKLGFYNTGDALSSSADQDDQQSDIRNDVMESYLTSENDQSRILNFDNNFISKSQTQQEHPDTIDNVKSDFNLLSRTSGDFRKRSSAESDKSDELKLFDEYQLRKPLFILPPMSFSYGSRVKTSPPNLTGFNRQYEVKGNSFNRPPVLFSKQAQSNTDSESAVGIDMNTLKSDLNTQSENLIPKLCSIVSRLSSSARMKNCNIGSWIFNLPDAGLRDQGEITEKQTIDIGETGSGIKAFIIENREYEKRANSKDDDADVNEVDLPRRDNTNVNSNKRRYLSSVDRMPPFFGKRDAGTFPQISNVVSNIYQKQNDANPNSIELPNYKLASVPVEQTMQSGSLEDLNSSELTFQSAKRYHTKFGLDKTFAIWPNNQVRNILRPHI